MNLHDDNVVATTIDRIFDLLDVEHMWRLIDEPIDAAATTFRPEEKPVTTHLDFHQVIAGFVRHAYKHGVPLPKTLSPSQGCAEAISLLEAGYQSAEAHGYEAALLDVLNPAQNGLELVLAGLAESIKTQERRKHVEWVFASTLGPLEWQMRCQVAGHLRDQLRPFLPPMLQQCSAAQLADEIPTLITIDLGTMSLLKRIPSPPSALSI